MKHFILIIGFILSANAFADYTVNPGTIICEGDKKEMVNGQLTVVKSINIIVTSTKEIVKVSSGESVPAITYDNRNWVARKQKIEFTMREFDPKKQERTVYSALGYSSPMKVDTGYSALTSEYTIARDYIVVGQQRVETAELYLNFSSLDELYERFSYPWKFRGQMPTQFALKLKASASLTPYLVDNVTGAKSGDYAHIVTFDDINCVGNFYYQAQY